ncbi:response regulator transcription factor [Sphaerisporangium rubeum]|uniref:DNA-binding response OmpR family regulator n=1 Tax=Sphaerisporangium rubeum TaxID=321317 RepID=A0A7X0IL65_9ACTN|nr:response regulator transcription factor [Sphaerisporangium rubeum]MBB6476784.1 DNA-binding response OmpR family regulator [Sphaerisporangium rubeum]
MRVLIAEDERMLADSIAAGLRGESLTVDVAYDGTAALRRLAAHRYDVLVLDRNLPGLHGDDVCREAVDAGGVVRILMLSAAGDVRDRVTGLSIGADDYLSKPFAFEELVARIRSLARRATPADPPVLRRGDLTLDAVHRQVFRGGRYVPLARKEYAMLAELLRARGTVVSAETLLEKVWDERIDAFTNTVRTTMMKLRRKLGDPQLIETVPGVGYRIP